MTAQDIIEKYINFFKSRDHVQINGASLVPENDPTTLFTSSGMQPLVPYLLGEKHPQGRRLVNVQNCFRAQDIDEIGDNRHTTFFRMLGNWSLGDYFKREQITWFWEFLTQELRLPKEKLFVTVFEGGDGVEKDEESVEIWTEIFNKEGLDPKTKIFYYGVDKNWWSRAGVPDNMPVGEPGGPDSEVFFEFDIDHNPDYGEECHVNCDCGKYLEIGNSVFMQFKKEKNGFAKLPQQNVDFGGGLERLVAAVENNHDVFTTNLFKPVINAIESDTNKKYTEKSREMRIITDHMLAAIFISSEEIYPSNKEQGYVLRRLIRRALDNFYQLNGKNLTLVIESIIQQYKVTDPVIEEKYALIKGIILEEEQAYANTLKNAKEFLSKRYPIPQGEKHGDELKGVTQISSEDAFKLYTSYGLSPTQIKSLGYTFNNQEFSEKMKAHSLVSRAGAEKKFKGGLSDHSEKTIKGHTATHLLHQALRDVLGNHVFQRGSNITPERVRFDFNFERKLTDEEIKEVEEIVNQKIQDSLTVFNLVLPLEKGRELGAIGLFGEKYDENVKIYFIGEDEQKPESAYSKEFCGGPHVSNTAEIGSFKITKQEGLGKGIRRIYSVVE